MNVILFLDDDHNRAALAYQRWPKEKAHKTIWAKTAEEAIEVLENYEVEEVHLDHDLGGQKFVDTRREDCGMEVVRWLEKADLTKFKDTKFNVHSWNIQAAVIMESRLTKLNLNVTRKAFGM